MECIDFQNLFLSYVTSSNIFQVCLWLFLIYITINRKEISCNSDYHDKDSSSTQSKGTDESCSNTNNYSEHSNNSVNSSSCHESTDVREAIMTTSMSTAKYDSSFSNANNFTTPHRTCSTSTESTMDSIEHLTFSMIRSLSNSFKESDRTVLQVQQKHQQHPMILLELTPELQIQCLTFLHPRDIISLGCCNKSSYSLIHGPTKTNTREDNNICNESTTYVSEMLWLYLWNRDYAHIINTWDVAQDAIKQSLSNIHCEQEGTLEDIQTLRSNTIPTVLLPTIPSRLFPPSISKNEFITSSISKSITPTTMKEFYLIFSQTWLNYTIAGHSTFTSCYTGLHGHVFNITNFIDLHPGAPESILLQGGGRDSTSFFESVGHSLSARKIAVRELVEIVDLSCCSGYGDVGLHDGTIDDESNYNGDVSPSIPTSEKKKKKKNQKYIYGKNKKQRWPLTGLSSTVPDELSLIPKHRSRPKRTMGTLYRIRKQLDGNEKKVRVKAKHFMSKLKDDVVGKLNLYFDPFDGQWHGWYLNAQFETVFVHNLEQE